MQQGYVIAILFALINVVCVALLPPSALCLSVVKNNNDSIASFQPPDLFIGKWHGIFRDEIVWSLLRMEYGPRRITIADFERTARNNGTEENLRFVREFAYFDIELIIDRNGELLFNLDDSRFKYALFARLQSDYTFEGTLYQKSNDGTLLPMPQGMQRWTGSLELTPFGQLKLTFGHNLRLQQERGKILPNFILNDFAMRIFRASNRSLRGNVTLRDMGFLIEVSFIGSRSYLKKIYGPEFWMYHSEGLEPPEPRLLSQHSAGERPYSLFSEQDSREALVTAEEVIRSGYDALAQDSASIALSLFEQVELSTDTINSLMYSAAVLGKGIALSKLQREEEALQSFDTFTELRNDINDGLWYKATIYRKNRRFTEERSTYTQILERNEDDEYAHYRRAQAWFAAGVIDKAIADADTAIKKNDTTASIYQFRGSLLSTQGEFAKALADYNAALALDSSLIEARNNRAITLYHLEQHASALLAFDQLLQYDSTNAEWWYMRGLSAEQLGDFDKAYRSYQRSVRLKPTEPQAHVGAIEMLIKLLKFREALQWYEHASRQHPTIIPALAGKIRELRTSAQIDIVISDLERLHKADEKNIALVNDLVVLYFLASKYASSVEFYNKSLSLAGTPSSTEQHFYAASLLKIGKADEAEKIFLDLVKAEGITPVADYIFRTLMEDSSTAGFVSSLLTKIQQK